MISPLLKILLTKGNAEPHFDRSLSSQGHDVSKQLIYSVLRVPNIDSVRLSGVLERLPNLNQRGSLDCGGIFFGVSLVFF